jgi:hypothetical protein
LSKPADALQVRAELRRSSCLLTSLAALEDVVLHSLGHASVGCEGQLLAKLVALAVVLFDASLPTLPREHAAYPIPLLD